MILTAFRFEQLKRDAAFISEEEKTAFENSLDHERRSEAAYRAVATKRKNIKFGLHVAKTTNNFLHLSLILRKAI